MVKLTNSRPGKGNRHARRAGSEGTPPASGTRRRSRVSGRSFLKRSVMIGWDLGAWIFTAALVDFARSPSISWPPPWPSPTLYALVACPLLVVVGLLTKIYRGRFRVGTAEESLWVLITAALAGGALLLAFAVAPAHAGSLTLLLLAPPAAALLMVTGRWGYRELRLRSRGSLPDGAERSVIVGAGELGYQLVRLMQTSALSPYKVVAFVDDDVAKRHLRLRGVPVAGTRADLVDVARRFQASTVILGIGDAGPQLIREIEKVALDSGLTFMLSPNASGPHPVVRLSDLREVQIEDILGRGPVETDVDSIAGYLTGKRVLITGAGGSIGSELARQVHRFLPAELALLDRDESALHAVQLSIYGRGLLDTSDMVLADIRDPDSLRAAFEAHRPDVVFHAAALKHLPMLEQYPDEGWKTNVVGTLNVLELAAEYGVERFVNISTDKAADPTSVLGRTKRLAERMTAWQAEQSGGTYLSVRFGNVLGSRGSMLHTFLEQIEQGGPVTVTHPDVTRYFMTIPEACQLVIQAAAIGHDGEVLVLDMGRPVRILEVAERLIARSGKEVEIEFTGLRPGEKVHEQLFGADELGERPYHPLISHVPVPSLAPTSLEPAAHDRARAGDADETRQRVPGSLAGATAPTFLLPTMGNTDR